MLRVTCCGKIVVGRGLAPAIIIACIDCGRLIVAPTTQSATNLTRNLICVNIMMGLRVRGRNDDNCFVRKAKMVNIHLSNPFMA